MARKSHSVLAVWLGEAVKYWPFGITLNKVSFGMRFMLEIDGVKLPVEVTGEELKEIALAALKEDAVTKAHMRAQAAIIEERRREYEKEAQKQTLEWSEQCDCEHCDCNECEEEYERMTDQTREALLKVLKIL